MSFISEARRYLVESAQLEKFILFLVHEAKALTLSVIYVVKDILEHIRELLLYLKFVQIFSFRSVDVVISVPLNSVFHALDILFKVSLLINQLPDHLVFTDSLFSTHACSFF